ncbi:hypothetical protein ACIQI7_14045 [Kitasatospora sp. NPDC092039]|uniref:hypothetical protein n=1 Tax=Kitasatospora sp. NPDC092039 TaxID=3364086 RepID=UPI00382A2456
MADKDSGPGGPGGIGDRPQDDFVTRNLADPSERPARTLTLSGLLGDSDRAGFRRLYFNKQLDYYAEFASADVLSVDTVPGDRPPFVGHDATTVTLRRDATVHFTRVQTATPVDEFDLDLRLAQPRRAAAAPGPVTLPGPTFDGCHTRRLCVTDVDCPTDFGAGCTADTFRCTAGPGCATFDATCRCTADVVCGTVDTFRCTVGPACATFVGTCQCTAGPVCGTVDTFRCTAGPVCGTVETFRCTAGPVCGTFPTDPGVPGGPGGPRRFATGDACRTEFAATCQTCPGDTCRTCGDATCDTCHGATCRTCDTCNPHVFTCGPNPRCGP